MKKHTLILAGFVVLKLVLQFQLIHPIYDLQRDEYLHLDQANHLAWGYASVPPFTSWTSWLIQLLGNTVFWVKFFPALYGTLTMVLLWKVVEELKGGLYAKSLAAIAIICSVVTRLNILYQPNSFDVLAWTAIFFFVLKYINTNAPKWLYWLAFAFALGFLNKYNIAFLLLGLLPALLLSPHRKLIANKHFYLAILMALVLISPNLYWQYSNGFPVLAHMAELKRTQLDNFSRLDFLAAQPLYFVGILPILLFAFIALFSNQSFKQYRVYGYTFVFVLAIFTYFNAKAYYAIGLYPIFIAFGAVHIETLFQNKWRNFFRIAILAIPVFLFVVVIDLVYPLRTPDDYQHYLKPMRQLGMLTWEDGKEHNLQQDFADMLGWKELAHKTDSAYALVKDSGYTVVICGNYGETGAINYYSKYKNINATSLDADYLNWIKFDSAIVNVILIRGARDNDKERKEERPLFKIITKTGEITNPYAREKGTSIYLLKTAISDINKRIEGDIKEEKEGD